MRSGSDFAPVTTRINTRTRGFRSNNHHRGLLVGREFWYRIISCKIEAIPRKSRPTPETHNTRHKDLVQIPIKTKGNHWMARCLTIKFLRAQKWKANSSKLWNLLWGLLQQKLLTTLLRHSIHTTTNTTKLRCQQICIIHPRWVTSKWTITTTAKEACTLSNQWQTTVTNISIKLDS